MSLSSAELAIVSRLLDEAMAIPEDARETWVSNLLEHFPGSKRLLRHLLTLQKNGGIDAAIGSLPQLSKTIGADEAADDPTCLRAGDRIGNYRLIRELGRGGMGQVWLAEQTEPVRRIVAMKLVSAGFYDTMVVRRFRAERQSLAMMDHPAIAKVFDAGSTDKGQPYLVMEYVPGVPITEYCDSNRLNIAARIKLFIEVCEGVQHAHQKAIIHRDLKPANILIMEVDGRATPRIIDFGVAKPSSPASLPEHTLQTQFGQFLGTPGYMSPEQADPRVQDVDTRTDVYSLGVLFCVLLTGLQPFESRRRDNAPLDLHLRQLRTEDPPLLSAKLNADRDGATTTAEARSTSTRQLRRVLRGDLDCIGKKALERQRESRYGTPTELATDLGRWLRREPVLARPASVRDRMGKYARRHWAALATAGGLVLLLAIFSVLQASELRRITRERDRATRITEFMTGMFTVPDPSEARGRNVTAREILDKAAKDIGRGLDNDPEVVAQMQYVMASTYAHLGMYARAQELAESALSFRSKRYGSEDAATLESSGQLGWILDRRGHPAEAEQLERAALIGEQRAFGPGDARTLDSMVYFAVILDDQGRFAEGESTARQALDVSTRALGRTSVQALKATNVLAMTLLNESRYAEAEILYRRLIEDDRRVFGADNPQTLASMVSLGAAVGLQGRNTEAEQLYREVLALQQRVLGPEHQSTVLTMANLAQVLTNERRYPESERLLRETLQIRARTLGSEHRDTLTSTANLAELLFKEGRIQEAEHLMRETLAVEARVLGSENPDFLEGRSQFAGLLVREEKYAEAEEVAAGAFALQRRLLGSHHLDTIDTLRVLGRAMAYRDRYAEAERLFKEVTEEPLGSTPQGNRWSVWYAFAAVATAAHRNEDALRYLREAVKLGFIDAPSLTEDPEFADLNKEQQFKMLLASIKVPGEAAGPAVPGHQASQSGSREQPD